MSDRTWVERIRIAFDYHGLNTDKSTFRTFIERLYELPHFSDSQDYEMNGIFTVDFSNPDGELYSPLFYKYMVAMCWRERFSTAIWKTLLDGWLENGETKLEVM